MHIAPIHQSHAASQCACKARSKQVCTRPCARAPLQAACGSRQGSAGTGGGATFAMQGSHALVCPAWLTCTRLCPCHPRHRGSAARAGCLLKPSAQRRKYGEPLAGRSYQWRQEGRQRSSTCVYPRQGRAPGGLALQVCSEESLRVTAPAPRLATAGHHRAAVAQLGWHAAAGQQRACAVMCKGCSLQQPEPAPSA